MENEALCFIKFVGKDIDDNYKYEFLFTDKIDEFWGENFEYMPCCLVNELIPDEDEYNAVYELSTPLRLKIIQESCCHSFQDCIDGIVAIAYEDMSDYDEYPEEGRVVLHYGDTLEEVNEILEAKGEQLVEKNIDTAQ